MLWEHEVAGSNPVAQTSDFDFVVLLSSNAMDDTALPTLVAAGKSWRGRRVGQVGSLKQQVRLT
jgi:hypothetical protein